MGILDNASGFRMANRRDEPIRMEIRPGLNSTNDAYFHFYDNADTELYRMGLTAGSTFSIFDVVGGVELLSSGGAVTSIGNYLDTTAIKGLGSGLHTVFKSSDTATDNQVVSIGTRAYSAGTNAVFLAWAQNLVAANNLYIGGGGTVANTDAITYGYLRAGAGVTSTNGVTVLAWDQYGVNVGTLPAAPTSGRAFQVTTTGQTDAAYFDDTNGTLTMPWDAAGSSTAQLKLGAGAEFKIYQTAADSRIFTTGSLYTTASAGTMLHYVDTGYTHQFRVNSITTAQINANGLVLPLDGLTGTPNITMGIGADLKIFAGTASVIESLTGNFQIDNLAATGDNYFDVLTGNDQFFRVQDVKMVQVNGIGTSVAGAGATILTPATDEAFQVNTLQAGGKLWVNNTTGTLNIDHTGTSTNKHIQMGDTTKGYYIFHGSAQTVHKIEEGYFNFENKGASGFLINLRNAAGDYRIQTRDSGLPTFTVGVGATIDQHNATGAVPVLALDQADVSEPFIKYTGESGDGNSGQSFVDAAEYTTPGAIIGWVKVETSDAQLTNPMTDGVCYQPLYAVPTA